MTDKTVFSDLHKKHLGESRKGKKHSEESKIQIGLTRKKRWAEKKANQLAIKLANATIQSK